MNRKPSLIASACLILSISEVCRAQNFVPFDAPISSVPGLHDKVFQEFELARVPMLKDSSNKIIGFDTGSNDSQKKAFKDALLNALTDKRAFMSYFNREDNGSLSFLAVSGNDGCKSLVAMHTFYMYRTISLGGQTYYVGVGTQISATINQRNRAVSLGGLFGITAEATSRKLKGSIDSAVRGIGGPEIPILMPTPSTLDESSVTKALESFAVIRSKIYDPAYTLTPILLGASPDTIQSSRQAGVRIK